MLAVGDNDVHLSAQSDQLICTSVRDHGDSEFTGATRHCTAVLEVETSATAVQCSRNFFNCHITCRTLNTATACHQHLSLARTGKISLELFVDRHSADGRVSTLLWVQLNFKRSTGSISHSFFPFRLCL